jgi:hypothetical protein
MTKNTVEPLQQLTYHQTVLALATRDDDVVGNETSSTFDSGRFYLANIETQAS